jgi:two-component sensor histidine kinase
VPDGSVEISWGTERRSGNSLALEWTERDGPRVSKPQRNGFGLALVEREVNEGLGGKVNIQFEESGLRATLKIPLEME